MNESADTDTSAARLRVGFVLLPRFTLTAFSGFADALRLASDEGDRSRQLKCQWSILGNDLPIESSCGVSVLPTAPFSDPSEFDYIVVVGGLLHGGQKLPRGVPQYLQRAADAGVNLVGVCTGSFALARAGLLEGRLTCVSWFHRDEFVREFPECKVVSNQMYVIDHQRFTCAGGTSVVHLAAYIIGHVLNRASAVKALRILIEKQPLPPRTLQPEFVVEEQGTDNVVKKAMLLLEQNLSGALELQQVAHSVGLGRRQLERRFHLDVGLTPGEYRQRLRLDQSRRMLEHTNMPVVDIAFECGFQSSAYFSRLVRKTYGCTPMQLRRRINPRDR